jgi:hypothetical protein
MASSKKIFCYLIFRPKVFLWQRSEIIFYRLILKTPTKLNQMIGYYSFRDIRYWKASHRGCPGIPFADKMPGEAHGSKTIHRFKDFHCCLPPALRKCLAASLLHTLFQIWNLMWNFQDKSIQSNTYHPYRITVFGFRYTLRW